ncbi:MAG: carbon starvation protein A [Akkermansia sp.]|nr:carbon starvation protein A [Akkermansia sp.]
MSMGLLLFFVCAMALVLGYLVYSRIAERVYGVDFKMAMPCKTKADGVDYVEMPTWKIFLIQLLNIAGLGPVFGALAGCLFGPVALLWIVLGCILAGALHDFLAALMSAEKGGANLPELVQSHLGKGAGYVMRGLCVVLMLLVGVVFTSGPAGMLHAIVSNVSVTTWCVCILLYYFLATILPIDVIIGRLYPIFGALFIFMAVGLAVALPFGEQEVLPITDFCANLHPQNLSVWPMIFVTIACGAISGFHATQSPMMVRCLPDVRRARPVFYGAMVAEGLVALIWATVGLTLRDTLTDYTMVSNAAGKLVPQLAGEGQTLASFAQLTLSSPATAVSHACTALLGDVGAALAVLGVVVLPITSGDTAMRCCRLMLADALRVEQKSWLRRLLIAVPLFACVIFISQIDFSIIWRYFGWANQTLACFTLWSIAVCLRRRARLHWLATVPALFMTTVCTSFLLYAPECIIGLPMQVATLSGVGVSALCLAIFLWRVRP